MSLIHDKSTKRMDSQSASGKNAASTARVRDPDLQPCTVIIIMMHTQTHTYHTAKTIRFKRTQTQTVRHTHGDN